MTTRYLGTEIVSNNIADVSQALLDLNWSIIGSGATIETTNPLTGARAVNINYATTTRLATTGRLLRPLVALYWGMGFRFPSAPIADTNLVEFVIGGAVKRELSILTTRGIQWFKGDETGIGDGPLWVQAANTPVWVVGEIFPWGRRPYERLWRYDGTTWVKELDSVYAPVSDLAATPQRQVDIDAWGDSGASLTLVFGNSSKAATTFTAIIDDPWFICPPSDTSALEYAENNRRGRLRVAKMMPDADVTTDWDQATPHFSKVNEIPVADIAAAGALTQVDEDAASKVELFDLEATPAGLRPICVKVVAGGRNLGTTDSQGLEIGIVSGSDERVIKPTTVSGTMDSDTGVGVAVGYANEYIEHPPNVTAGAWTETLANAARATARTIAGNANRYAIGGIGVEVLYEDGAAQDLRCEPLVSAW